MDRVSVRYLEVNLGTVVAFMLQGLARMGLGIAVSLDIPVLSCSLVDCPRREPEHAVSAQRPVLDRHTGMTGATFENVDLVHRRKLPNRLAPPK